MSKDSMAVLNPKKSNPNDDEDENHNNTPRLGQDPELSLDTPEEDMNSEQAVKALGECTMVEMTLKKGSNNFEIK